MSQSSQASNATVDVMRLGEYLRFNGLTHTADISVQPLSGGQSNPTFRVHAGTQRYVLRTKPAGDTLPGAHAIDREYRVMAALQATDVPVPRVHTYCDDPEVIGTPFYVMDWLDGRVLVDQSLPGMSSTERADIYAEMNRVMATLHAVDPANVGLSDYGRAGNYFARQISRWSRQSKESTLPMGDAMRRLMDWLPENVPPGDETTLVHGDFRLDNLIFHPTKPEVLGVLDWELSTLGHPLADFAYHCMSWHIPATLWRGIGGLDLGSLGIPTETSYVEAYARATGRSPEEHWDFYMAYNLFRMAAILRGIGQRAADGTAAAADAVDISLKADPLAEIGWNCALRYEANR